MGIDRATKLEARVRRLERQNRTLILIGVLAICFFGLVGLRRDDDKIVDTLKARALVLYSADNEVIVTAGFSTWTKGGAVTIYDEKGERRSWWRANPGGAHLFLNSKAYDDGDEESLLRHAVVLASFESHSSISLVGLGGMAVIDASKEEVPKMIIYTNEAGAEPSFSTVKVDRH